MRAAAAVIAVFGLAGCLRGQSDAVLIHGARVIDGTGAPARAVSVRIYGGRIDAVGTDVAAPSGARVVEAGGQTLIPGLFDLHTHLSASAVTGVSADWRKNLEAYLASGVSWLRLQGAGLAFDYSGEVSGGIPGEPMEGGIAGEG